MKFAPKVRYPRYGQMAEMTPPGYVWLMAFAIAGCEWAIETLDSPGYREKVLREIGENESLTSSHL